MHHSYLFYILVVYKYLKSLFVFNVHQAEKSWIDGEQTTIFFILKPRIFPVFISQQSASTQRIQRDRTINSFDVSIAESGGRHSYFYDFRVVNFCYTYRKRHLDYLLFFSTRYYSLSYTSQLKTILHFLIRLSRYQQKCGSNSYRDLVQTQNIEDI